MRAAQIHQYGSPDVFQLEQIDLASPAPGQVHIKQSHAGLNFIDIYMRTGVYPAGDFPAILGMEGAGEIIAVGEGVSGFTVGDRVDAVEKGIINIEVNQRWSLDEIQQAHRTLEAGETIGCSVLEL